MASTKRFSVRREAATEGGGVDGALATITKIGYVDSFKYQNGVKGGFALEASYDIDGFDRPWVQNYSGGKANDGSEISDDGYSFKPASKSGGLNKKSNAFHFFDALETAAEESKLNIDELLPEGEEGWSESVEPLEGRRVRLTTVKIEDQDGNKKDLVVIGGFVEDEEALKGKAGAKKAGKVDIEGEAEAAITALLEDTSPIKAKDVAKMLFDADKKNPNIKAMMNLAYKTSWISDEDRPWTYDAKRQVLKAAE